MDTRMTTTFEIYPDLLASQLSQNAANWLYDGMAKRILSVPQGMPEPMPIVKKRFDFSYRGFKYPSFILGNNRNLVSEKISGRFHALGLQVNHSYFERLPKAEWMDLLSRSRVTAASQAGSSRVFRSDQVWYELRADSRVRLINSDNPVVHISRFLPHTMKSHLRKFLVNGKTVYGSLHDQFEPAELLRAQVQNSILPSTDGRTISSRHFDAIAAGCWQILEQGDYNEILKPYIDYTPISDLAECSVANAVDHAQGMTNPIILRELQSRIFEFNSYKSRIHSILRSLS
jgi:hypothetical protein